MLMKDTFSNKNQFVLNLMPFSECGFHFIPQGFYFQELHGSPNPE